MSLYASFTWKRIVTVWWCLRPFPMLCSFMWVNEFWVPKCARTTFFNFALKYGSRGLQEEENKQGFVGQPKVFFWLTFIRESESAFFFLVSRLVKAENIKVAETHLEPKHLLHIDTTKVWSQLKVNQYFPGSKSTSVSLSHKMFGISNLILS